MRCTSHPFRFSAIVGISFFCSSPISFNFPPGCLYPVDPFHFLPSVFVVLSLSVPLRIYSFPLLYTLNQWTTPNFRENPGPIILTLHKSHPSCTLKRRSILLDASPARYSTVRPPHTHPSITLTLTAHGLGIVVALFFQCMRTLLSPTENTRGIKWHLVIHTIIMFSLVTVHTALILYLPSISYVDNRGYPGTDTLPPGPIIYLGLFSDRAIGITSRLLFPLNQWLADGLMVGSVTTLTARGPNVDFLLALSLLHYLFYESQDHRLPLPDIHRIFGCVSWPSAIQ